MIVEGTAQVAEQDSGEFMAAILGAAVGGACAIVATLLGNKHSRGQLRKDWLAQYSGDAAEALYNVDLTKLGGQDPNGMDPTFYVAVLRLKHWVKKDEAFEAEVNCWLFLLTSGFLPQGLVPRDSSLIYTVDRQKAILECSRELSDELSKLAKIREGKVIESLARARRRWEAALKTLAIQHGHLPGPPANWADNPHNAPSGGLYRLILPSMRKAPTCRPN